MEWLQLNHFVILRTVLSIISQGLGLHPDRCVHSKLDTFALKWYYSFWELHHRQDGLPDAIHTKDLFRATMYRQSTIMLALSLDKLTCRSDPPSEEDREKAEKLWLPAHADR